MCGIAGIVGKRPVNPAAVKAMTDIQAHRGPDGEGLWQSDDRQVVLGHRRLAIIDPTPAGAQPMADPSGNLVLTYNGEIYNYIEVAEQLRREGVNFQSKSDSEVLLQAYRQWGTDCLSRLNGMFSFAIYDGEKKRLFCARDRFGEKPFVYRVHADYIAFASEYKALFVLEGAEPTVDDMALLRFVHQPRMGLDDARATVFADVEQLLPGEMLVVDLRTLDYTVERYWDVEPDADVAKLSEHDVLVHFRELLANSVQIRMRSDVPLGSCLSGGLDSSAIVCLAREALGDDPDYHVFTGRFPGTEADEGEFADIVVDATRSTPHITEPTAEGFLRDLQDFAWTNELPTGSSSQYAQFCVFKLAKEHGITVLLDGQGADELLGGYEQYFRPYMTALDEVGDTGDRAAERDAIQVRYPMALAGGGENLKTSLPLGLSWRIAQLTGKGSNLLFGVDLGLARQMKAEAEIKREPRFHALTGALYDDSFRSHLPTLLRYGDRNSMAHSREVRLPFCDHRIAEFALSLGPRQLMGGPETKRLIRRSLNGTLPEAIRTRWNKQGFLPPQHLWFKDGLLALARETFADPVFRQRGYWRTGWWERVLARLEAGENHLAWTVWKPLMAEAWQRHFVERARATPKVSALVAA